MSDVAECYAKALYGLCRDEETLDEALDDLDKLSAAFGANPRFTAILSSPEITKQEKRTLLDNCFRGVAQQRVLSCMKLLCDKGHMRCFVKLCAFFRDLYNEEHGILPIKVYTAKTLSAAQKDRLKQKLEALSGKIVLLVAVTDESCLGGMRIEYGDKRIDDTLKHRLNEIGRLIQNTKV